MKYILFLIPCFFVMGCRSGDQGDTTPVVAVAVQRATVEDVPLVVSAPGSVFGQSEAHIAARITAPVREVFVHKGEAVRKGQILAVLERSDLEAEQAEASSGVTIAEANLQQTQAGRIPDQLNQARADLSVKTAALGLAQKVYERRKQLFSEGAISGRELQVSEVDDVQAKANYDAAKMRLDLLEHQINSTDLKIGQGTLAEAKARKQLAIADLSFTELRSPINGVVTDQTIYPGDMANPDVPIFTVADLSYAVARAQVNADQASSIATGQTCSFEQKQDGTSRLSPRFGRITVVNQAVDPARYTVEVWCRIPNADHALKAGLFGAVRIVVGQVHGAVVIPSSAIEFEEGTSRGKIYTVDAQHLAHLRHVQAVSLNDNRVRVLSGLKPEDLVITEGEYGLPDEMKVNPHEVPN